MLSVYTCLTQEHDIRLVGLAAAICFLSALTGFVLAHQVRSGARQRQVGWLALLAFVSGAGIWATHFIAMLAYQPHLPTSYTPGTTLLSVLLSIAGAGLAWNAALKGGRYAGLLSGGIMAAGISAMHFTGMAAFRTTGQLQYSVSEVSLALLAGVLCTVAATYLFVTRKRSRFLSATLLTLAICIIHFGSMAAVTLIPDPTITIPPSAIDTAALTVVIGSLSVAVLGITIAVAAIEARLRRHAAEEGERLKHFAQSALEGLAILEGDRIIDANERFWHLVGHDASRASGSLHLFDFLPRGPEQREDLLISPFQEQALRNATGDMIDVEVAIRTATVGGVHREMLVVRDITEKKAATARIAHLASHDPLTGVANRLTLDRMLAQSVTHPSTEKPFALICLDLDRFKSINDLHGHPAGDAVLIEVGHRIQSCLEEGDLVARLGGDEFAVVHHTEEHPHDAALLAERIIDLVSQPIAFEGLSLHVGTSIGIALFPSNATSAVDLHKKADLALYRAKAEGRGILRFFDEAMDRQLSKRHSMEQDLRMAASRGELHLLYQPLACLETGGIVGFESLLRWTHPVHGPVSPAEFVPLAEETGVITTIGEWVLREACQEAARWKQPLKIAVNLSPAQFGTDHIVDIVKKVLDETGLDPGRLDLEITEGLLIKNPERALPTLNQLRTLGVRIVMDDFGTGYSSLSYFRTFPFDKIKIDQTFVRDLTESREALAIVKAIIGLGKGLGLSIIAEGVETVEQMELLLAEGCHKIQGYLVSPPQPIAHFDWLVVDPLSSGHPCHGRCEACFERLRAPTGLRSPRGDIMRLSTSRM